MNIKNISSEKKQALQWALENPELVIRARCKASYLKFFEIFWEVISTEPLQMNWHIPYICEVLQDIAEKIAVKEYPGFDYLIINIPPGTSKSSIVSRLFPVWCWTRWPWMRFITGSYTSPLALELAEDSRDVLRSAKFKKVFPDIVIKQDADSKTHFKIERRKINTGSRFVSYDRGGGRMSTSVGGKGTGFHGDILLIDDPQNPQKVYSKVELEKSNRWITETLSTRKTNKEIVPIVIIMQRLHPLDATGYILKLARQKNLKVKHICLPGSIKEGVKVYPENLRSNYKNGLLDPVRLNEAILKKLKSELGQFGYAGQIDQNPIPPGKGMFQTDKIPVIHEVPPSTQIKRIVRYWDKAGSDGTGAFTAGVKIAELRNGKFLVMDVVRGQWASGERESRIKTTAEADGKNVLIGIEQEPGSGGKESAESTVRNLAGYYVNKDRPTGNKVFRADTFSVQVNDHNVLMLYGAWNDNFIDEYKLFPFSEYKDQVDAGSGAFNMLTGKKQARV